MTPILCDRYRNEKHTSPRSVRFNSKTKRNYNIHTNVRIFTTPSTTQLYNRLTGYTGSVKPLYPTPSRSILCSHRLPIILTAFLPSKTRQIYPIPLIMAFTLRKSSPASWSVLEMDLMAQRQAQPLQQVRQEQDQDGDRHSMVWMRHCVD